MMLQQSASIEGTIEQLASLCICRVPQMQLAVEQLKQFKVANIIEQNGNIILSCRKRLRDCEISELRRKAGVASGTKRQQTPQQRVRTPSASLSLSSSVPASGNGGTGERDFPEIQVPSWEEVQAQCQIIGLVEWKAEDWFNEMKQTGWRDNKGREVKDWRAYLTRIRVWWERDGRQMEPPSKSNGSISGAETMVAQKEYDRVVARMKTIRSDYGDHQNWNESDKIEYGSLKERKAELKSKLGIKV